MSALRPVHADLAGAAQFLDEALLGAGVVAADPAVEADVGLVFGHGAGLEGHAGGLGRGGGWVKTGIANRWPLVRRRQDCHC